MLAAISVLPDGFALPPLPYLVGLGMATLVVGVLLVLVRPPFRPWDVLAVGTWMAVGATLHALAWLGAFPAWADPLFGTPAVYFTTFVVMGLVWLVAAVGAAAGFFASIPRLLGIVGGTVAAVFMIFFVVTGIQTPGFGIEPLWPVAGLVVSLVVAALAVIALSLTYTEAVATTGKTGVFVVFAHALDGVTTAIGVDVLGVGERTPIPREIMNLAADLPTAQYVGVGWLFVLVKLALALVVVALFADYVREEPARGNLALAFVAAVGVGPGTYNLLLYLVSAAPA